MGGFHTIDFGDDLMALPNLQLSGTIGNVLTLADDAALEVIELDVRYQERMMHVGRDR